MNKLNKGKLLGIVAAGLSTVSLMGVGFAAWVINDGDNKDVENITITVAGTQDNTITFDPAPTLTDGTINFDAKANDTTGPITWDGTHSEKLNFKIEYTIKCVNTEKFDGVKAYMTIDNATSVAGKALADAIETKNYLIAPLSTEKAASVKIANSLTAETNDLNTDQLPNKKYETTVTKTDNTSYKFTTKFSFNWGTTFGKMNPSEFATTETFLTAKNALTELQSASNAAFTIHLEAVSSVTNA